MKVISTLIHKGGEGKTTSSIHLASALSGPQAKVLLIDLDRQCNLTNGFGASKVKYTIKDFLDGDYDDFKLYQVPSHNIYILRGSKLLDESDYQSNLDIIKTRLSQLNSLMEDSKYRPFDYVIIDCPPNVPQPDKKGKLYNLGELALVSSDYVFSPVQADEIYSFEGINQMINTFVNIREKYNPNLEYLGAFFNLVEENTTRFKETIEQINQNPSIKEYIFDTYVRKDENINKAKKLGKSIFSYKSNSRAAKDYKNLIREIKKKMNI